MSVGITYAAIHEREHLVEDRWSELSQPLGVLNYRCYLRDETGRFADTKIFGARDDNEVAAFAFALFIQASGVYDRFEALTKGRASPRLSSLSSDTR